MANFIDQNQDPRSLIEQILTKQGSKDLQKLLNFNPKMSISEKQEQETLVNFLIDRIKVSKKFSHLLVDQYGNYFCQKLFPRLNNGHKMDLLQELVITQPGATKPKVEIIPPECYQNNLTMS